jgi:hypothetical protein
VNTGAHSQVLHHENACNVCRAEAEEQFCEAMHHMIAPMRVGTVLKQFCAE